MLRDFLKSESEASDEEKDEDEDEDEMEEEDDDADDNDDEEEDDDEEEGVGSNGSDDNVIRVEDDSGSEGAPSPPATRRSPKRRVRPPRLWGGKVTIRTQCAVVLMTAPGPSAFSQGASKTRGTRERKAAKAAKVKTKAQIKVRVRRLQKAVLCGARTLTWNAPLLNILSISQKSSK